MTHSERKRTNEDLHFDIKTTLSRYPRLAAVLPIDYPEHQRYGVTITAMETINTSRKAEYWHFTNLPYALHLLAPEKPQDARDLADSWLSTLEMFVALCAHLPGALRSLSPLWQQQWGEAPIFWSVLAAAHRAVNMSNAGYKIEGFELKIGPGECDADLVFKLPSGGRVWFDVEMWHRPKLGDSSLQDARSVVLKRVQTKARKKFVSLPNSDIGVVGIVAVPKQGDFERFGNEPGLSGYFSIPGVSNQHGHVGWVAGLRNNDGVLRWGIVSADSGFDLTPQ